MSAKTANPKKIALLFKTSEDISLEHIEKRVERARKCHPNAKVWVRIINR